MLFLEICCPACSQPLSSSQDKLRPPYLSLTCAPIRLSRVTEMKRVPSTKGTRANGMMQRRASHRYATLL